jgi:glycosyltransferase involved in cell wall biosynthesis
LHIAIDITALLPRGTGVDAYIKQTVRHLARIDSENRYTLFLNYEDRNLFDRQLPGNFAIRTLSLRPRPVRALFQQAVLPAVAGAEGVDVIHSPAFLLPYLSGGPRHLLAVHDMTFFQMPERHSRLRRSAPFLWAVRKSICKADLICVPSEATRAALLAEIPDVAPARIRLIPYGVDPRFGPAPPQRTEAALERLGLKLPYILFVGTLEPRKNVRLLVESYRRLVAAGDVEEHLVLSGQPGWGIEALERDLQAPELRGRVHRLGYVAAQDLDCVYHGARLFVYPSQCEGFGLPPLEAMACGIPVIATENSSLAENLAGAAELVPNGDAQALACAMRDLLRSPERRAQRRALGFARAARFRWDAAAAETLECYRELARRGPVR